MRFIVFMYTLADDLVVGVCVCVRVCMCMCVRG